jgi:hypothetical protein
MTAHAAARQARRSAPTWQEIAGGQSGPTSPACPTRPGSVRAGTARRGRGDLLHDVPPRALHPQAPGGVPAGTAQRSLRSTQSRRPGTAIHQNPNGTYEVSDIRIPPIFPRKQDSAARPEATAETVPACRPALRLVKDEHHPPVPEADRFTRSFPDEKQPEGSPGDGGPHNRIAAGKPSSPNANARGPSRTTETDREHGL